MWTTREGASLIEAIYAVLKLLNLTFPEAARRLSEHRDVIPSFETARALGAGGKELSEMLQPLIYGVDRNGCKVREWVDFVNTLPSL